MRRIILVLLLTLALLLASCDALLGGAGSNGNGDNSGNIGGVGNGGVGNGGDGGSGNSNNSSGDGNGGSNSGGATCSSHTDVNNDGNCDSCSVSVLVVFDFYAINDIHGKLDDGDSHEGVDEMTTYLKSVTASDDNYIIFSSGDSWQGSSESNLTAGKIMTDWMNELDFSFMALGNHEYDWGEEAILANAELAEFPFLAINVYDRDTNQRVSYAEASLLIDAGEVQIGVIGAIGDCYSSISGEQSGGIYFKVGDELTELVKAESERLRAMGADFILYSIHDGYGKSSSGVKQISSSQIASYYDTELSDGYVDIVFEGHTHQKYVLRDQYGVYHLQGDGDNKGITHAEAVINTANGSSRVRTTEFVSDSVYRNLADDPLIDELLEKYKDEISRAHEILGSNGKYRTGDEIRQIVAELYLEAGLAKWGEKYNIFLGGGYMSVRDPYNLSAGEVAYSDLMSILPFDNRLVLCSISGKYLKWKFTETSNSNYFIAYSEYGEKLLDSIDDNATYYLITDTYSSSYAPNNLTVIDYYTPNVYARDLLAEYVKRGGLK